MLAAVSLMLWIHSRSRPEAAAKCFSCYWIRLNVGELRTSRSRSRTWTGEPC